MSTPPQDPATAPATDPATSGDAAPASAADLDKAVDASPAPASAAGVDQAGGPGPASAVDLDRASAPGTWWAVPARIAPAPASGTNGQAIAAFVLGLLAVIPVSVVFGIVALVRVRRTRQRGKGLAIAGLVLSGVWALVGVGGVIGGALYLSSHGKPGTAFAPGARLLDQLRPGTCFDRADATSRWVSVVSCDKPHDAQYLATAPPPFTTYPGKSQSQAQSYRTCLDAEYAAFPDPAALPSYSELFFVYPSQESWDGGSRQVRCYLHFTGPQGTAALVQRRSDFTALQLGFLTHEQAVRTPAAAFAFLTEDEWDAGHVDSRGVAAAERAEAAWLTNTAWSASADSLARALAADDLREARLWDAVSAATDKGTWLAARSAVDPREPRDGDLMFLRAELKLNP